MKNKGSKLTPERERIYNDLEVELINTPLEKYDGEVPNGNSIYIKRQCDSLFGSHYDLPYLRLFKHYESQGIISPGDHVFESTSGSAGVSCGGIGRLLGYSVYIVIPSGGEKAREEAIKAQGAKLDVTENPKEYVNEFMKYNKRFLVKKNKTEGEKVYYLNHSMGKTKEEVNEISLSAFEVLAKESIEELLKQGKSIDYFLPAIGNGSSLLGPGRVFDKSKTSIVGFEPFQAALPYDILHPGLYESIYGIVPGTLSKQALPGMIFQTKEKHIPVPHIIKSIENNVLDESILVSEEATDKEYYELTGKENSLLLPHWDKENAPYNGLGRSTQCGIEVCKQLAKKVSDKNFLIIGYDKIDRYDKWK